jgi:hypothetical protein
MSSDGSGGITLPRPPGQVVLFDFIAGRVLIVAWPWVKS